MHLNRGPRSITGHPRRRNSAHSSRPTHATHTRLHVRRSSPRVPLSSKARGAESLEYNLRLDFRRFHRLWEVGDTYCPNSAGRLPKSIHEIQLWGTQPPLIVPVSISFVFNIQFGSNTFPSQTTTRNRRVIVKPSHYDEGTDYESHSSLHFKPQASSLDLASPSMVSSNRHSAYDQFHQPSSFGPLRQFSVSSLIQFVYVPRYAEHTFLGGDSVPLYLD